MLVPLSACLATAVREGLIRHNPARDVDLPHRPTAEDSDDDEVRVLSREQLETFLEIAPSRHRLFFELLAATGVRVSEAIGLQWRHVVLDGSMPHLPIRQDIVQGRLSSLRTRYSRCEIPIDRELVVALRRRRADSEWPGDRDHVQASRPFGR